jgi:hypothetical protein
MSAGAREPEITFFGFYPGNLQMPFNPDSDKKGPCLKMKQGPFFVGF